MVKTVGRDSRGNPRVVGGMAGNDKFPGPITCAECGRTYDKRPPSRLIREMIADGWSIGWSDSGRVQNMCPDHANGGR